MILQVNIYIYTHTRVQNRVKNSKTVKLGQNQPNSVKTDQVNEFDKE